jgi:hypothetical protein
MTDVSRRWKLQGFPEKVGGVPGGVEKAWTDWLALCEIDPTTGGERLQGDDVRYTAEVPNAVFADAEGGWKLMCDYDVYPPNLSQRGRAVFVEMDFVPGDVLAE